MPAERDKLTDLVYSSASLIVAVARQVPTVPTPMSVSISIRCAMSPAVSDAVNGDLNGPIECTRIRETFSEYVARNGPLDTTRESKTIDLQFGMSVRDPYHNRTTSFSQ